MARTDKFLALLNKLIGDASAMIQTAMPVGHGFRQIQDREAIMRWSNELILFKSLAEELIAPWSARLRHTGEAIYTRDMEPQLSALKAIKFAIDEGLLTRFEDLVIADTIGDLTEQADYLLGQNFFLAAGVIYRAVLEERLRKLCERHSCLPTKPHSTLADLNQALYKARIYDKSMMLHVTALASDGNDAAHNKPGFTKEQVERLQSGVRDFFARFST